MIRAPLLLALIIGTLLPGMSAPAAGRETPADNAPEPRAVSPGSIRARTTISIITECTPAGREAPLPTAEKPVYVMTHSGGRHDYGRPIAGQQPPAAGALLAALNAALATAHYLPASPQHPPTLIIFLNWGIHASPEYGQQDPGLHNLLDRAALVGGFKFAQQLKSVLEQTDMAAASTPTQPWGLQQPGMNPVTPSVLWQGFSPLESFRNRSLLNERLLAQISQDCYYVVVSAFDYDALARGQRRLLWRTKLTAPTQSASMTNAVFALVRTGARDYGRDMKGPELVSVGGK